MREVIRGVKERHSKHGKVMSVFFWADPDRDPQINPQWEKTERLKYSSQGAWDREQLIVHSAGGGERLFADTLTRWGHKIVVDPTKVQIPPQWRKIGGFDHGKANPTAALVACIDHDGTIWLIAEYYKSGLGPADHSLFLRQLPGFMQTPEVVADPSIFYKTQAQRDGSFKAIASLYIDVGITNLVPAPDNTEITGMERIAAHWMNLEVSEPTLKILCPPELQDLQRPLEGLCVNGCPNLLWELKRTRRAELTAMQLVNQNPTERIIDKENHARDALKYICLSLPEPTKATPQMLAQEQLKSIPITDATSRMAFWPNAVQDNSPKPVAIGRRGQYIAGRIGPHGRRKF